MSNRTYSNIIVETGDVRVTRVTINRPAVLNAMNYAALEELKEALLEIDKDPDVRVLVITGSGDKSFVVGADLKEMQSSGGEPERAEAFEALGRQTLNLIDGLGKPSICAVNGYALGLGLQLALACTFRIASSKAKFGLPEINMGFLPVLGATQRLTRLVGEAKAAEMILVGDCIDAAEAFRIGLVNMVLPEAQFMAFIDRFAERLAEKEPMAIRLAMAAIKKEKGTSLKDGLSYEAELSKSLREEARCLKTRSVGDKDGTEI